MGRFALRSMMADPKVKALLLQYSSLVLTDDEQKVKCSISGHEMGLSEQAIKTYVNGKKFKKLQAGESCLGKDESYQDSRKHLVDSNKKGHEKQLFCTLTLRHLNNDPVHIQRHLKGKRFCRAFAKWKECQKSGEKFVPRGGQRRRREEDDMSQEERRPQKEDDLSDLYPPADFDSDMERVKVEKGKESLQNDAEGMEATDSSSSSDSDFEFEDLEELPEKAAQSKSNNSTNATKRKSKGMNGPPVKKAKKGKKKK